MAKYTNLSFLLLGIILAAFLLSTEVFQNFIVKIGDFGYLGAFFTGIFFVSTFTVVPSSVTLYLLGENLNPYFLALVAGAGAVVGDFLIFRFVKDQLSSEIESLASAIFRRSYLVRIGQLKTFSYLLPVVGAAIIASPFPDELGLALMGLAKIKTGKLILVTFILNSLGIFMIVEAASLL